MILHRALFLLFLGLISCDAHLVGAEYRVDCSTTSGEIRPLHGGNCGPLGGGGLVDLSPAYRELGLPSLRLHDCHWPNPDVVDIHVVFPDFNADADKSDSYQFAATDEYVRACVETSSAVVYRLGESIEHTTTKYHVHPPGDARKWAAICAGVVRHYNGGWAGGFHYNIRYWEIWNEPENRPAMWTGTDADYLQLYRVTSAVLRSQFPDIKIGGPALGYSAAYKDGKFEPSQFMLKFLAMCRDEKLPLDFFSWHLYTDYPRECVGRCAGVRETLNRYGFEKTESHLNEWNYLPGNDWSPLMLKGQGVPREHFFEQVGGMDGAAFSACVLMNLQDAPLDMANYYAADSLPFGLFTLNGTPRKTFFAFKAFHALLQTPKRLSATCAEPSRQSICAGANAEGSKVQILISSFSSFNAKFDTTVAALPWKGRTAARTFILDSSKNLQVDAPQTLPAGDLKISRESAGPTVMLIELTPTKD